MVTCATIGIDGADVPGREHRLMNFFQISEGLEDQQIHAAFDQRCNLLAEGIAGFLKRSLAQRFDSGTQRANRSGDPHIEAFGGFASQANTRRD